MRFMVLFAVIGLLGDVVVASTVSLSPANCSIAGDGAASADFVGSFTLTDLGAGSARLTITLENRSASDVWLTALTFDGGGGTANWTVDAAASSGIGASWRDVALVGPVDWGALGLRESGGILADGSPPTEGLAVGATATVVFTGNYNPEDPLTSEQNFLADWAGPGNLIVIGTGVSPQAVPGFGGLAALAAGAAAVRRRRRRIA